MKHLTLPLSLSDSSQKYVAESIYLFVYLSPTQSFPLSLTHTVPVTFHITSSAHLSPLSGPDQFKAGWSGLFMSTNCHSERVALNLESSFICVEPFCVFKEKLCQLSITRAVSLWEGNSLDSSFLLVNGTFGFLSCVSTIWSQPTFGLCLWPVWPEHHVLTDFLESFLCLLKGESLDSILQTEEG